MISRLREVARTGSKELNIEKSKVSSTSPRSLIHVGRVTNHVGLVLSIMSSLDPTKSPKLHGLGSTEPTSSVESITSTKLQVSAELLPDEKSDVALSAAPVSEAFCFEDIDL